MHRVSLLFLFFWGVLEATAAERMTCKQAMQRLIEGNERYVQDSLEHPNRTSIRREAVAVKQSPFAAIVGCSDSRVSPEIVFDQGIGDLFIVRVAGNVIGNIELDSVEYAVLHLGTGCIIVMGHENCGAVQAVVEGKANDIPSIAKLIKPSVKESKKSAPDDLLTQAIKDNAIRMKNFLLDSKAIKALVQEKKVSVHAAYYDLATGAVEWLQ